MTTAQITAQYVNPPKPGKKMGSIKTPDGVQYWVRGPMVSSFRQGGVYNIEYSSKPRDGGGEWLTVEKLIGEKEAPLSPKNNYRQRSNPAESEQIFTVALLKSYIEAGKIDFASKQSVIDAINTLREVYRQTFGASEAQRRDDMDDEIPYQ